MSSKRLSSGSPSVPGGHHPSPQAIAWLLLYLAAVLAPLGVLLVAPGPPGGGFWWDLAIGMGFAALVMMGIQFLLTARFRRATAPFGIDIVYAFHRYLAYVAVAFVILHPLILVVSNPALLSYLQPVGTPWEMTAGVASLLLLCGLVAASIWRKSFGIPYEAWRTTHLILAVGAVGLGFAHILGVGHYTATPAVKGVWYLIGGSILAVIIHVRVWKPWRSSRRPWRVVEVRPEAGDTWSVALEPEGHPGFDFQPGQFAWITFRASPFAMREHPFSIASAPSPSGRLEFAIKELGDFTRTIGDLNSGERAWVDGPYGSFTFEHHPGAPGYVFIAGGIGIAPMMGMLRALADSGDRRPHLLVSAHSSLDRIPLREEVARLEGCLNLDVVHVLEDPPDGWPGPEGWITRELLDDRIPADRDERHYFVCGPVPMIRAVEEMLGDLGVPPRQIHAELFDLV
jgi:predicted ferric reductase